MNNVDLLQQLKDIQLPEPPGLWPFAPGWWLLMLLLFFLFAVAFYFGYQWYLKNSRKRHFLKHLNTLDELEKLPAQKAISELSVLLKRIALQVFPRDQISLLQGEAWLIFLDEKGKTSLFKTGIGRALLTAPYQPNPQVEFKALKALASSWIKEVVNHV
jgi:hypothetical protein